MPPFARTLRAAACLTPALPSGLFRGLLCGLLGSLTACAAPRPPAYPPLEIRSALAGDFKAAVGTPREAADAVLSGDAFRRHAQLFPANAPVAAESSDAFQGDPSAGYVHVDTRLVGLSPEAAAALFGWQASGPWAFTTKRAEIERRTEADVLARYDGTLVSSPRLTLASGGSGDLSVLNQVAFLREFRITRTGTSLLVDPEVGVLSEGVSLAVSARRGDDAGDPIALDASLAMASIERPIREAAVEVFDGIAPVTLQQPLIRAQRLSTALELAPDEALVLIGLGSEGFDGLMFTILTAEPYVDDAAPSTPSETPSTAQVVRRTDVEAGG